MTGSLIPPIFLCLLSARLRYLQVVPDLKWRLFLSFPFYSGRNRYCDYKSLYKSTDIWNSFTRAYIYNYYRAHQHVISVIFSSLKIWIVRISCSLLVFFQIEWMASQYSFYKRNMNQDLCGSLLMSKVFVWKVRVAFADIMAGKSAKVFIPVHLPSTENTEDTRYKSTSWSGGLICT